MKSQGSESDGRELGDLKGQKEDGFDQNIICIMKFSNSKKDRYRKKDDSEHKKIR